MKFYTQAAKKKESEKRKRYYYADIEYSRESARQRMIKRMIVESQQKASDQEA